MTKLLVNPVAVVCSMAVGLAICLAAKVNPHAPAMLLAAGICLAAGAAGAVPMMLVRDTQPAATFQAGFLGTVLQLSVAVVLGAVILFGRQPGSAFVWWLLPLFWVTLLVHTALVVRMLRPATRPAQQA